MPDVSCACESHRGGSDVADLELISRNYKGEVYRCGQCCIVKRYTTPDAKERIQQDGVSLTDLVLNVPRLECHLGVARTVKPLWLSVDRGLICMEFAPGKRIAHLERNQLALAEFLYGAWLGHYQATVMGTRDEGPLFTDISVHNALYDARARRLLIIDPGRDFGRFGCVYEDLTQHLVSLLTTCIRRRINPYVASRRFLAGFKARATCKFVFARYMRAVSHELVRRLAGLARVRPLKVPLFVIGAVAAMPFLVVVVPVVLRGGRA